MTRQNLYVSPGPSCAAIDPTYCFRRTQDRRQYGAAAQGLHVGRGVQRVRGPGRGHDRPEPDHDGGQRVLGAGQGVHLAQLRHRTRSVQLGQVLPLAAAVDRPAQRPAAPLHRQHRVQERRVRARHLQVRLRALQRRTRFQVNIRARFDYIPYYRYLPIYIMYSAVHRNVKLSCSLDELEKMFIRRAI